MLSIKLLKVKKQEIHSIFSTKKIGYFTTQKVFSGGGKIVTNNGNISNPHPNHTYTCVRENATEWHPEF